MLGPEMRAHVALDEWIMMREHGRDRGPLKKTNEKADRSSHRLFRPPGFGALRAVPLPASDQLNANLPMSPKSSARAAAAGKSSQELHERKRLAIPHINMSHKSMDQMNQHAQEFSANLSEIRTQLSGRLHTSRVQPAKPMTEVDLVAALKPNPRPPSSRQDGSTPQAGQQPTTPRRKDTFQTTEVTEKPGGMQTQQTAAEIEQQQREKENEGYHHEGEPLFFDPVALQEHAEELVRDGTQKKWLHYQAQKLPPGVIDVVGGAGPAELDDEEKRGGGKKRRSRSVDRPTSYSSSTTNLLGATVADLKNLATKAKEHIANDLAKTPISSRPAKMRALGPPASLLAEQQPWSHLDEKQWPAHVERLDSELPRVSVTGGHIHPAHHHALGSNEAGSSSKETTELPHEQALTVQSYNVHDGSSTREAAVEAANPLPRKELVTGWVAEEEEGRIVWPPRVDAVDVDNGGQETGSDKMEEFHNFDDSSVYHGSKDAPTQVQDDRGGLTGSEEVGAGADNMIAAPAPRAGKKVVQLTLT
eukprot:g10068.t1